MAKIMETNGRSETSPRIGGLVWIVSVGLSVNAAAHLGKDLGVIPRAVIAGLVFAGVILILQTIGQAWVAVFRKGPSRGYDATDGCKGPSGGHDVTDGRIELVALRRTASLDDAPDQLYR